jgi:hypothetical protein
MKKIYILLLSSLVLGSVKGAEPEKSFLQPIPQKTDKKVGIDLVYGSLASAIATLNSMQTLKKIIPLSNDVDKSSGLDTALKTKLQKYLNRSGKLHLSAFGIFLTSTVCYCVLAVKSWQKQRNL